MMTEQATHTQTLMERDALYPTQPDTDEICIRGDNVYEGPKRSDDTEDDDGDTIVRGDNSYSEWIKKPGEIPLHDAIESELQRLYGLLDLKVTDLLAVQLLNKGQTDTESVSNLINTYFTNEKSWYFNAAQYTSETELAAAESLPVTTRQGFKDKEDELDRLDLRYQMQVEMVNQIEAAQPQNENQSYRLAEAYIARLKHSAEEILLKIHSEKEAMEAQAQIVEIPTQRSHEEEIRRQTIEAQQLAA